MTARNPQSALYDVGYRKPPRHTQFHKGRSGNPGGRPRRTEIERMKALALSEAYRLVKVTDANGIVWPMPALGAILRSQIELATKGNIAARRAVLSMIRSIEQEEAGKARHAEIMGEEYRLPGADDDEDYDDETDDSEEIEDDEEIGDGEETDGAEATAEDEEIEDGAVTARGEPAVDGDAADSALLETDDTPPAQQTVPPARAPFDAQPQTSQPEAPEPATSEPPASEPASPARTAAKPAPRRRGASQPLMPPLDASAGRRAACMKGRRKAGDNRRRGTNSKNSKIPC
jgi:hypothetical protein